MGSTSCMETEDGEPLGGMMLPYLVGVLEGGVLVLWFR